MKILVYLTLVMFFLFYTWNLYQLPVSEKDNTNSVMEGKRVWQQKNCNACHQIYGLGGFLGPDLTNAYSSQGKGPEYIKAFIQNGTVTMPAFQLTEKEVNSLLAFLQHADASGTSSPKTFNANWNGTIEHK